MFRPEAHANQAGGYPAEHRQALQQFESRRHGYRFVAVQKRLDDLVLNQ